MTCIVGLVDDGVVYIGGDSASVGGYDRSVETQPKVFRRGDLLIGSSGCWRTMQLVHYKLQIPEHRRDKQSDREWLCVDFVDALRSCLKESGLERKYDGAERTDGLLLVGYHGHLDVVQGDYAVLESQDGYDAIGCGKGFALGSLYSTPGLRGERRVQDALYTAAHFSAGVCEPFMVESLKGGNE